MIDRRLFIAAGLAAAGCASSRHQTTLNDEYIIINTALNELVCAESDLTNFLLDKTIENPGIAPREYDEDELWISLDFPIIELLSRHSDLSRIEASTIEQYYSKNLRPTIIDRSQVAFPCGSIVDQNMEADIRSSIYSSENELRENPDSLNLIRITQVGFNSKRTQGLLHVVQECGGLCGQGVLVVAERDEHQSWNTFEYIETFVA